MNKKKSTEPVKAAAAAAPGGKALAGKTGGTKTVTPGERQLKAGENAAQVFRQRQLSRAGEASREVAAGPAAHIADKARSYIQICDRQTSVPSLDLHTAEDHFNYGVARLNARDVAEAATH